MTYSWSKKRLWELFNNKDVKEELSSLFNSFWDIFDLTDSGSLKPKDTLLFDADTFLDNPFIGEAAMKFTGLGYKTIPREYATLKLSQGEIMNLTKGFYGTLDDEIYTAFLKIFKHRHTHLKFSNMLFFTSYDGYTYHSSSSGDTFIKLANTGNMDNLFACIHEFGHAISYTFKDKIDNPYRGDLFIEIEAIFMELLAMDYFESLSPEMADAVNAERILLYNSILNDIKDTVNKVNIVMELINEKIDVQRSFYPGLIAYLKDRLNLSSKEVKDASKFTLESLFSYPFGALIAIELYKLYHDDPVKAMDIYKSIIKTNNISDQDFYKMIKSMGISPCSNVDYFVRKISRD